jgi:hypothetical protein
VAKLAVATCLVLGVSAAAKDTQTTCQDICDSIDSVSCTISSAHDIAAGSHVDCTSARAITINSGGELRAHDSAFVLSGKSLLLINGGKIVIDCPQDFEGIGADIRVVEDIHVASLGGSKIEARCDVAGGAIGLEAGGDITIAGNGIDVSGTAADAPGGEVVLEAGDTVTVESAIAADATGGAADGGRIDIRATDVEIEATLSAKGYGQTSGEGQGGEIVISAGGDVTISAGTGLLATAAQGAGGTISIDADGFVDVDKPLKAQGTSGSAGVGGSAAITADGIALDHEVNVSGGYDGGTVDLDARGGGISVGTGGQSTVVDARGNSGEAGGEIRVRAQGSHVVIGDQAILYVTGVSGVGGSLEVAGVDVTTESGAKLYANGSSPSNGGTLEVQSRGALDLDGTIQANNGGSLAFLYRDGTPTIDTGITGYDLVELPDLPAPCGDGIRIAGSGGEDCDGADLGGETCASQSQGTGTLACTSSCTFDYTDCSGS